MNVELSKELAFCNKEQSILLKELGFDWACKTYYPKNSESGEVWSVDDSTFSNSDTKGYIAPTVALAIQFLDSKGIFIEAAISKDFDWFFVYTEKQGDKLVLLFCESDMVYFLSRAEAMSAGLTHALQYLKSIQK